MNLKVLILVTTCNFFFILQTKAECIFYTTLEDKIKPMFFRDTDYHTNLLTNHFASISMQENEVIIGYCKNGFESPRNGEYTIKIQCENNEIEIFYEYNGYRRPPSKMFTCKPEIKHIKSPCTVQLAPLKAYRPTFSKKIGTRNITMSPEIQKFQLQNSQQATVHCNTRFKSPSHSTTELNLICLNSGILLLDRPFAFANYVFECESIQWNLYESQIAFPWCPSSMTSYILARPLGNNNYEFSAGICYDLEEMSFKSLYYSIGSQLSKNLSPPILTSYKPFLEIADISETFISKKTLQYDNMQIEKWIQFSKYQNTSILQSSQLHKNLMQEIEQLLTIDWWSNLQLGNWRFYEEALAKHINSYNYTFDILAGTSGVVTAPIQKVSCDQNLTMMELIDTENNKLPLYIWNLLKSPTNASEDVVIIGVNSPFSDFYDEKDLIFCNDICHQLEWLDNVHITFRYRPLGIIFCCTIDEVIASQHLDGFALPKVYVPPTPKSLDISNYRFLYLTETTPTETTVSDEIEYSVPENDYE